MKIVLWLARSSFRFPWKFSNADDKSLALPDVRWFDDTIRCERELEMEVASFVTAATVHWESPAAESGVVQIEFIILPIGYRERPPCLRRWYFLEHRTSTMCGRDPKFCWRSSGDRGRAVSVKGFCSLERPYTYHEAGGLPKDFAASGT